MSADNVKRFPRRAWKAGKVDILRSGWPLRSRPPNADIRQALGALRARSRHEAQNNDHARAFLREVKSNVIGPQGVTLQSRAQMGRGKPDTRARDAIESAWIEWGAWGVPDASCRLSWCDIQHQCIETVARDGEAVYRVLEGWEGNDHGFALQVIDPECVDSDFTTTLPNGNQVVMGVEIDEWGRHINYWMIPPDPQQRTYRSVRNAKREPVPAEDVLFLHLPEWVAQTRGVPWMTTALRRMNDLEGYDESAVVAARGGAAKHGHYKPSEDAQPVIGADGELQYGPADGEDMTGQLFSSFEPGAIGVLPPGWDYEVVDPKYPHAEHGNFTKAVLRGISAGLGVSYNHLANDLEGVNYSSLREGRLVQEALWTMLQEWLIGSFHQQVYRRWLSVQLYLGTLRDYRGRPLQESREKAFQRVQWQPRRWKWVDPLKEANAAKQEIEMNIRSVSSVIRERGGDPEQVWDEIVRERERMAELGITPAEAAAAATEVTDEDEDSD